MIRSEHRRAAAMQFGGFQFQRFVEVDVVEMYDGQKAGISARTLQMQSNISTPEMLAKQSRDQPASPFVEITEHNPWPRNLAVAEDGFTDQFARLASPLDERGSEMHVVDMQPALFSQSDVDAQASALFAPGHADVVVL